MNPFRRFHKKHGPAFDCELVSEESCGLYSEKLPNGLLEMWRGQGWCGYHDGFLWTVDPGDFDDVLSGWSDVVDGSLAFLRTAFGGIFYWDGTDAFYLDVLAGDSSMVFPRMDMIFDSLLCDNEYLNDVLRYDLFRKALPKLGRLRKDECYAFLPPLSMGGPGTLETLKKVKMREHLAILAQVDSER